MAAELAPTRPVLTVIEGGRGSVDWRIEEAEAELTARRSEEQAMDAQLRPIVRRLRVVAQASGPTAYRDLSALEYLLTRHARRWADEEGQAA